MPFLQNRWYAAGWSNEIGQKPLGRRILDNEVTFYRTSDGSIAAVSSRCPHRFAPMHYGDVEGDNIRCRYHGLLFAPDGRCVQNPDGSAPPPMKLRKYHAREDAGMVWVWIGDNEPSAELPELVRYATTNPYGAMVTGYVHVKANYLMLTDNLVDHSHATHLHELLRSEAAVKHSKGEVVDDGETIIAKHFDPDGAPSPFFRAVYPTSGNVDQFVDHKWQAPGFITIEAGVTDVGGSFDEGVRMCSVHLIVPETENTAHYFWGQARSCLLDDEAFSAKLHQGLEHIFTTEDAWMMEGQAKMMEGQDYWALRPALLPQDRATALVRKRMEKLLEDQAKSRTPEAVT